MKALGFILGFALTGALEYAFVLAMGERFGLVGLQIQGLGFLILPVGVGLAAGFFGIGGGFLIVPGLILATAMPLPYAIGTSLVVVSGLGLTLATSYATSGLVDWGVTGLLVAGGVGGTITGITLSKVLGTRKGMLERGFAVIVIAVGVYVIASST